MEDAAKKLEESKEKINRLKGCLERLDDRINQFGI